MRRKGRRTCQVSGDRTNPPLTAVGASQENRSRMARLHGLVVTLLVASLAVASPALADITIDYRAPAINHGGTPIITGDALNDRITITQNANTYDISRDGGSVIAPATGTIPECSPTNVAVASVSCPRVEGISIDLKGGNDMLTTSGVTTPLEATGGSENDFLQGGFGPDVLAGGDGNDTLTGGGGVDEFFGEAGDDMIESRDSVAERISCGAGDDRRDNDFMDILAECERGTDTDADGFATGVDCNDGTRIHPGRPRPPRERHRRGLRRPRHRNLDRDADGFPRPADCNDADPVDPPRRARVRGNKVDENCDLRAGEPFAVSARRCFLSTWRLQRRAPRSLRKLVVRNASEGRTDRPHLERASGCTFHKAKRLTVKRHLDSGRA